MNVKELIKEYLSKENETLTNVINKINLNKTDEEKTTVQNINNKLTRETIKYTEILEIADALGYDIVWEKRKKAITQSAKSASSEYTTKSYTAGNSVAGSVMGASIGSVMASKTAGVLDLLVGGLIGGSWLKSGTTTGSKRPKVLSEQLKLYQDRIDLEYELEANINFILDNIVSSCDELVYERYEDLIETYQSTKDSSVAFKLTSLFRVIFKLISVHPDAGLRDFIMGVRTIYTNGGLASLNDEELKNLYDVSKYYKNMFAHKK